MKKLLAIPVVAAFVVGSASKKHEKFYHPTDDINASSQGRKMALKVTVMKLILGLKKSQQKFSTKMQESFMLKSSLTKKINFFFLFK